MSKNTRKEPQPGYILPDDPLTKWLEKPETRVALTQMLLKENPPGSLRPVALTRHSPPGRSRQAKSQQSTDDYQRTEDELFQRMLQVKTYPMAPEPPSQQEIEALKRLSRRK